MFTVLDSNHCCATNFNIDGIPLRGKDSDQKKNAVCKPGELYIKGRQ